MQDCSNSIANAQEILHSCTKPLICIKVLANELQVHQQNADFGYKIVVILVENYNVIQNHNYKLDISFFSTIKL